MKLGGIRTWNVRKEGINADHLNNNDVYVSYLTTTTAQCLSALREPRDLVQGLPRYTRYIKTGTSTRLVGQRTRHQRKRQSVNRLEVVKTK